MRYILSLFYIFNVTLLFSQTITLNPIGDTKINNVSVEVEHFVNYVPNHSISSVTFNPLGTTGTGVVVGDDSNVGPYNIGFNFEFYGQTFSQFRICSNGFITFGSTDATYTPGTFPNTNQPNGVVAGYWTDLFPTSGYYIRYRTDGVAPNRQLVVSYHMAYYSQKNTWVDFQIVLFENTNKIQTTIISQGWSPTSTQGVENHTGTLAATPPGRNLMGFNGTGTTYEYTPMATITQWESQGAKITSTSGTVSFSNPSNWDYRVSITTNSTTNIMNENDLDYLFFQKANIIPMESWDFYTCDIDGNGIFEWDDLTEGHQNLIQGNTLPTYVFTYNEKVDIETNNTTNYVTTYPPTQNRMISNENQFYIMGVGKHKTTINQLNKIE